MKKYAVCKKDYTWDKDPITFIEGKTYEILVTHPSSSYIDAFVVLKCEVNFTKLNMDDFKTHFYTTSEIRKMKLEKIRKNA